MKARLLWPLALICVSTLSACGESPSTGKSASFERRFLSSGADDRNPYLTPGQLCTQDDPDFDELRYPEQIPHCRRRVTESQKRAIGYSYGIDLADFSLYQFDHFLPLGLGGSNANLNVWPLIYAEARRKAALEQQLYHRLNRGEITQAQALNTIRAWR